MTETFYKRVVSPSGRIKYEPVLWYEQEVTNSFPLGTHLVTVTPGLVRQRRVDPELATYEALPHLLIDETADMILDALKYEPPHNELTEEQRTAWEALSESLGREAILWRPSAYDLASKILETLAQRAKELKEN